ncbi:hypothetical protein TNCV_3611151 [Trichonephila clavipes]|nr:hypothetical protein TNCV_3611151 [Trichonephila clavipes]
MNKAHVAKGMSTFYSARKHARYSILIFHNFREANLEAFHFILWSSSKAGTKQLQDSPSSTLTLSSSTLATPLFSTFVPPTRLLSLHSGLLLSPDTNRLYNMGWRLASQAKCSETSGLVGCTYLENAFNYCLKRCRSSMLGFVKIMCMIT